MLRGCYHELGCSCKLLEVRMTVCLQVDEDWRVFTNGTWRSLAIFLPQAPWKLESCKTRESMSCSSDERRLVNCYVSFQLSLEILLEIPLSVWRRIQAECIIWLSGTSNIVLCFLFSLHQQPCVYHFFPASATSLMKINLICLKCFLYYFLEAATEVFIRSALHCSPAGNESSKEV